MKLGYPTLRIKRQRKLKGSWGYGWVKGQNKCCKISRR
jgi:hypothetical protein